MPRIETINIASLPTEWDQYCVGMMRNLIADAILMDDCRKLQNAENWTNAERTTAPPRTWFVHECLDALENAQPNSQLQLSSLMLSRAYKYLPENDPKLEARCFTVGLSTVRRVIDCGVVPKNNGVSPHLWHTLGEGRFLLEQLSEHAGGNAERQADVFDCTLLAAQAYASRLPENVGFLLKDARTLAQGNPQREAKLLHATINVLAPCLLGIRSLANTREITGLISELSGVFLEEVGLKASTVFIPAPKELGYPNQFLFMGPDSKGIFFRQNGFVSSVWRAQCQIEAAQRRPPGHQFPDDAKAEERRLFLVNTANELFSRSRTCPDIHDAMLQLMETKGGRPDILPLFRQQIASPALSA